MQNHISSFQFPEKRDIHLFDRITRDIYQDYIYFFKDEKMRHNIKKKKENASNCVNVADF